MSNKLWGFATTVAAIGGASVAKKLSDAIWKRATNEYVPEDPEDPAVDWGRAIAYAALSGAAVQLIRLVINRQSVKTYTKATGHRP